MTTTFFPTLRLAESKMAAGEITTTEFAAWVVISQGRERMSHAQIASRLRRGWRQVIRIINRLEAVGLLVVERLGARRINRYSATVSRLAIVAGAAVVMDDSPLRGSLRDRHSLGCAGENLKQRVEKTQSVSSVAQPGRLVATLGRKAIEAEANTAIAEWNLLSWEVGLAEARRYDPDQLDRVISVLAFIGGLPEWCRLLEEVRAATWLHGRQRLARSRTTIGVLLGRATRQRLAAGMYRTSGDDLDQEHRWRQRLCGWVTDRRWNSLRWGPRPGSKGCRCPRDLIDEAEEHGADDVWRLQAGEAA